MLTKDKVRILTDGLPETFTVEEMVEKLVFLEKIEKEVKDIEERNGYSIEDVKEDFKRLSE